RRHTRSKRDWSSDVCSSDLLVLAVYGGLSQQSWMFGPFTKPALVNPVITPNPAVAWEAYATFNPAAVVKDGKIFLLYRAEDATRSEEHTSELQSRFDLVCRL